ncbi:hypothetical protein [Aeromicrobium fastidiosum]|uniref:Uncharacterized protein n=1 Tax=Aeromicrobium fastidiosum TaxID=52699 RepID=A0A641AMQ3_9ACTN|nr:hypothetical protein [Aeromicrobium fastidiosum]KAA1378554.1 hypothetical protein ESP62_009420 [Aeromicrobium fastidiosum]MBP2392475.1 hypothetical protein [Aeromicrobium fastidiosum]
MGWFQRRAAATHDEHHFSFDGAPTHRETTCASCAEVHEGTTGFVLDHGDAHAIYWADWFPHGREMILNIVVGDFGDDADYTDNVIFGIRYGYVAQQTQMAASLIAPTVVDTATGAHPLDRERALQHWRLPDLWHVSDWLVENDPLLHEHVFHAPRHAG